ncbi:MAG: histidine phosphatase family protein [Hyphomicrobiaceae bacterium]
MSNDSIVPADKLPIRSFYFLRHGETQYNLERIFQGCIDVPLNSTGVAQAQAAAKVLAEEQFTRIVASPANRVLKTASFASEMTGAPLHVDSDLMEFDVGSFAGQCITTTKRAHGLDEHDSFMSILPDDADTWREFVPRVCAAVRRWTDRHPDETLLIVAHGLVFRALTLSLADAEFTSRNAEPYLFEKRVSSWEVKRLE